MVIFLKQRNYLRCSHAKIRTRNEVDGLFSQEELRDLLKYMRRAKDQTKDLFEAMMDIETYGEVDHDGMPVVNSIEIQEDLLKMEHLIRKIEEMSRNETRETHNLDW